MLRARRRQETLSWAPLLLCLVSITGCRYVAGYGEGPSSSGPDLAGDLRQSDLSAPDMPRALDRGTDPDGADPCAAPTERPLLHFTFDDIGHPPDTPLSNEGSTPVVAYLKNAASIAAQGRCGGALLIPPDQDDPPHLVIPDHGDFQLRVGLIDLWVRFDRHHTELKDMEGIISRDAVLQKQGGHFALLRTKEGNILARLQHQGGGAGIACVAASFIAARSWHRVQVAFGGNARLRVYLDGTVGTAQTNDKDWECGSGLDSTLGVGIEGNQNPWVVGASTINARDGVAQASLPLVGAIDELRLYGSRGKL